MTHDPSNGDQGPPAEAAEAEVGQPHSFGDQAGEMANETEVEEARSAQGGATPAEDELTVTKMDLAERTADLQRLQAEFLNYKRRVDRDRDLIRENATYVVLTPIIDVLDTVDRAREHGDLDEGFRAVADQLERVVTGRGGPRGRGHHVQGDREGRLPHRRAGRPRRAGARGRPAERADRIAH